MHAHAHNIYSFPPCAPHDRSRIITCLLPPVKLLFPLMSAQTLNTVVKKEFNKKGVNVVLGEINVSVY